MYLEKLEIQGFKSFAKKNLLKFPGMIDATKRGITAVVGPNGSGKSNVADAVRWVLGEQSMKTLRGKKSEDVIFSGSDIKGKLGMAEVSIYLNNEDRQAPIDYSELVITRRLYRNGDSEYLLNSARVRLSDIQILLAKSKFGQKTYSVIGQGMVEGFLNTSLSERKEFFDEATGVKQYQIKRDLSLGKLRGSYENLIQAQMLVNEIEPRLRSLTRQVNRLKKRDLIEKELKNEQTVYYSKIWHEINNKFSKYNNEFLELEKTKFDKDKKLTNLNKQLAAMEEEGGSADKLSELQEKLNAAQAGKDEFSTRLAKLEARTEIKLEANGKFDLSFLMNKKTDLAKEIELLEEEIAIQEKSIAISQTAATEIANGRSAINKKIEGLNQQLKMANERAGEFRPVHNRLRAVVDRLGEAHGHGDIEKIKVIIKEIENEIRELIAIAEQVGGENTEGAVDLKEVYESLERAIKEKDEVIVKVNENNLRITARSERVKLLKEKQNNLKAEVSQVEEKLEQQADGFDLGSIHEQQAKIKQGLMNANEEVARIKKAIGEITTNDEIVRSKLFQLQKEYSRVQQEINLVNNKLNELKINSTRYETKLEDLEIEIREEYGDLGKIKSSSLNEEIEPAKSKEKISQLKHQLELIGGIDPEVEGEYNETKERFDFLSGQISDFTGAVGSLNKIIKELDLTIKAQFDKEFKIIANNFEKYFKILFNGGHAKIIKVMEPEETKESEDQGEKKELENGEVQEKAKEGEIGMADLKKIKFLQKHNATGLAGIEIQATPPGKKIKSVAMLSGGERALTAIALISAIISSNPSPFVVLDEVDAALDEANSERLARILDELSLKTQFIVITHNRATMRRANILYGVTMGNDGVSKLLSVKLDEVSKK